MRRGGAEPAARPQRMLRILRDSARNAVPIASFLWARSRNAKFPLAVTLCITNRCNFRCEYCHMPTTERDELDTAAWLRAIDEFHAAGTRRCSLMGGEPLVRRDVGKLIAHLVERRIHAAMNTNGWFVRDRIEDVAKLDLVCVGLDGPVEIHDVQRRRRGSHARAVEAIELLLSRGVEVVTMTPVTPRGIDHIDEMLRLAREVGFRAGFQIEHDADCDVRKPIGEGLSDTRLSALAEHLLRRKAEGWPVAMSRTFLRAFAARGRRMLASCTECHVPRHTCMVRPDGMVVPCFLTQHQGPMASGPAHGFVRAFHDIAQPDGPGCASQPLMELHSVLALRPEAVANALSLA
jgi:MoaA/NifB/PqqE/SkfB family radical SAM enzyme